MNNIKEHILLILVLTLLIVIILRKLKCKNLIIGKKGVNIDLDNIIINKFISLTDGLYFYKANLLKETYFVDNNSNIVKKFFLENIFYGENIFDDGIYFIKNKQECLIMIGCYGILHNKNNKTGIFLQPMHIELYINLKEKKMYNLLSTSIFRFGFISINPFTLINDFQKEIAVKIINFCLENININKFSYQDLKEVNLFNKYFFKKIKFNTKNIK